MRCQWIWCDFGQPVYWSSGVCSCVAVDLTTTNLEGMSCSGTCWPLGGAWFQCRYGGVCWAPIDLCCLEWGVLWSSQDLDFSPLLLVFSFIFTVASRLLHLYSTNDKTTRLEMKSFSTLRDTQRGSLFLKTMICFSGCLMSSASTQKLFCEIYSALKCSFDEFVGKKVVSPSYSSAILGLPREKEIVKNPFKYLKWLTINNKYSVILI